MSALRFMESTHDQSFLHGDSEPGIGAPVSGPARLGYHHAVETLALPGPVHAKPREIRMNNAPLLRQPVVRLRVGELERDDVTVALD